MNLSNAKTPQQSFYYNSHMQSATLYGIQQEMGTQQVPQVVVQGTNVGEKHELKSEKSVPGNWRLVKRMLGCQLPGQPWTLL